MRLAKRLAAAETNTVHAITDGAEEVDPGQRERDEISKKLFDSRRRYLAETGSKKEKELATKHWAGGPQVMPGVDDLAKMREADEKRAAAQREAARLQRAALRQSD